MSQPARTPSAGVRTPSSSAASTQGRTGGFSVFLGAVAVFLFAVPWIPQTLPAQFRWQVLFVAAPMGVCAVVSGLTTLREMREDDAADRRWARLGTALGCLAIALTLAFVVVIWWAISSLDG